MNYFPFDLKRELESHGLDAIRAVDLVKTRTRTLVDLVVMLSRMAHDPGEVCACPMRKVEWTRRLGFNDR
jgi:hypothetical protein